MNYWEEKHEFWGNKTDGNAIYDAQGRELGDHLNELIGRYGAYNVLDVGGYKGRMRQYITPKVMYFNYDIVNGMDITQPWEKPNEPRIKYDFVFTSLTLLCFPPEQVEQIIWNMKGHAIKAVILYEEDWTHQLGFEDGKKLSDDYGGKWQYNWLKLLHAAAGNVTVKRSQVNKNWAIYTQFRNV